jgi:hypothetical protein
MVFCRSRWAAAHSSLLRYVLLHLFMYRRKQVLHLESGIRFSDQDIRMRLQRRMSSRAQHLALCFHPQARDA